MRREQSQTTTRRMACWNCPRYDRAEFRCKDGKANPRKKTDSILVAEVLGIRTLCHYNLYRDVIALRTHYPGSQASIVSTQHALAGKRKKRRFKAGIEPDIAADMEHSGSSTA
jgi:hypothetical protein